MRMLPRFSCRPTIAAIIILIASAPFLHATPIIKVGNGHGDRVGAMAISPDGELMLTGSADNLVKLWEVSRRRELRTLIGHSSSVECISFLPGGRTAVSGGDDGTLRVWDLATGSELQRINTPLTYVLAIALSHDGKSIACGGCNMRKDNEALIVVYSLSTGAELRQIPRRDYEDLVQTLEYTPDDSALIGCVDRSLRAWELRSSGQDIFGTAGARYSSGRLLPDGKTVLAAAEDGRLELWALRAGAKGGALLAKSLKTKVGVYTLQLSPDGALAYCGMEDGMVRVINLASGAEEAAISTGDDFVASLALMPGVSGILASNGKEGTIEQIDLRSGGAQAFGIEGVSRASAIAAIPDGDAFIACFGETLLRHDLRSPRPNNILLQHSSPFTSLALSKDGSYFLAGASDGSVFAPDPAAPGKGDLVPDLKSSSGITALSLSRDSKRALIGNEKREVWLWDIADRRISRRIPGGGELPIRDLAFSPDGAFAYINDGYSRPGRWNLVKDGKLSRLEWSSVQSMLASSSTTACALSPDGLTLATGSYEGLFSLWDAAVGKEAFSSKRGAGISAVAFSPNGGIIASGNRVGTIEIWDPRSRSLLRDLRGGAGAIRVLAFSPDGRLLYASCSDGTIRIWDPLSGKELLACLVTAGGDWLRWTPEGWFEGSPKAMRDAVYIVDGFRTLELEQVFDSCYRPDLIQARLAGRDIPRLSPKGIAAGIAVPPEVSIAAERADGSYRGLAVVAAKAPFRVVEGKVRILAKAVDKGGGIGAVRIFHNGKILGERMAGALAGKAGLAELELPMTVALADGGNLLEALATSRDGTESARLSLEIEYSAAVSAPPTLWLLAVGIDKYKNPKYDLNFAQGDVSSFVGSLRKPAERLFDSVRVTVLANEGAGKAGLAAAFAAISAKAAPDDVFVFFYAGHGIALEGDSPGNLDFYFILHGVTQMTSPALVAKEAISGAEFRAMVASVKARKQCLILDACNSGALAEAFVRRGAAEEVALAKLSRSTGSVLIAGSQASQFAQEFAALKHGALTQALVEGLEGAAAGPDGQITAASLMSYVDSALPAITTRCSGVAQYSTGFLFGQDFPIGLR
jgi:WD40 repeat protein